MRREHLRPSAFIRGSLEGSESARRDLYHGIAMHFRTMVRIHLIRGRTADEELLRNEKPVYMKKYKDITTFEDLLDREHGAIGIDPRSTYEAASQMFIISEMLKEAHKEANLTQEQLAERTGTKKSYISKLENGKGNIQISTLIRSFEQGLNRRIGLTFL